MVLILVIISFLLIVLIILLMKKEIHNEEEFQMDPKDIQYLKESREWFITLVGGFSGGFSNRVRTMVAYKLLSDYLHKKVSFIWKNDVYCQCNFKDIFNTELVKEYKVYDQCPKGKKDIPCNVDSIHSLSTKFTKDETVINKLKNKEGEYWLKLFIPNRSIIEKSRHFISMNFKGDFNAVHIRMKNEFVENTKGSTGGKTQNYKEFEDFIEKSKLPVFCTTDTLAKRKELEKKFGTKVKFYGDNWDENSYRASTVEDAICCILICIQADNFKGTFYSSFSGLISTLRRLKKSNVQSKN